MIAWIRMVENSDIKPKGWKKKRKGSLLLPVILCVAGLLVLFFPVVMDWYASYQASQIISEMTDAYEPIDDPELVALKENARDYNLALVGVETDTELLPYEEQMRYRNIEQMAWIDIPKIQVALPVYHGTSPDALAAGVGHLERSSLPIGGDSTHAVLTGHSGMQGERMFDEIRRLQVGDTFIVHSLGEPYAYRVYDIETVWPEETDGLRIQSGRDLCTLITCTPYGINDHRLLVHGERCEYLPEMEPKLPPEITYWNTRSAIFFAAACFVALFLLALIWRARRRRLDDTVLKVRKQVGDGNAGEVADTGSGKRKKKASSLILPVVLVLAGVLVLFSSVIVDWFQTFQAATVIDEMSASVLEMDAAEKDRLLYQASVYNQVMAGDTVAYSQMEEPLLPYSEQLSYEGSDKMAWVDIPKINTKVPVYHGTDEDTLMVGAGHIEHTSLPVGGESSHTVISAHSGMALTRMFDELNRIEPGDTFIIWTLGDPYAYRVDSIETVLPDEVDSIKIEHGSDKATLVTCTPYGINSHRLLVHASRVPYYPDLDTVPVQAYFNYRTVPFLIGAVVGAVFFAFMIREYNRRMKAL